MSIQENKQLVMRGYEQFKNGDIQGLLDNFADDIEWIGAESDYIPFAGNCYGKNQVAEYFMKMDQAQEVQQFEPQEVIAEGDKVVVTGQSKWKVKSTGKTYENPWVHVFTIKDGKTARFQQYNHTAAAEAAFMPAEGASQQKEDVVRH
jgi:ketosteroid isomerase-like protein